MLYLEQKNSILENKYNKMSCHFYKMFPNVLAVLFKLISCIYRQLNPLRDFSDILKCGSVEKL